ncbi:MAG TPA: NAD-dependent epimerase/dehydratase family protein [Acidimicrobiales bacterium]|jgi:nucleoside-diphosphate-sugar epimerase|nr:NAD-dependent epimerase/dehydratase family protein [Acidimicrobiales bacterium]
MRTLVIGGTGPTGPYVVEALLARGHDVTILHRGTHEPPGFPALEQIEHIHADPHFREPLDAALAARTFDTVVAMYGRMALNVEVCAGRCERFISVGGNPAHRGHLDRRSAFPEGMKILANERDPIASGEVSARDRFAAKVVAAERAVMDAHAAGTFRATHFRYPIIYGRGAVLAFERWVVRRLLDGERRLILPDGGLSIYTHCADRNAARFVASALDHPDAASGQIYQCADEDQFSVVQWTQLIGDALGVEPEIVSVPLALARPVWNLLPTGPLASPHSLVDITKARRELDYRDVVPARDALRELVEHLTSDPRETESVNRDVAAEHAVIAAFDELDARLTDTLGWEPTEEPNPRWHTYDHPTEQTAKRPE